MRTVLWLIALGLADISSSILKVNGMWKGADDGTISFFAVIFFIGAVMDVTELIRGKQ